MKLKPKITIAEQSADYVITLKKNQRNLYSSVEQLFKEAISKGFEGFQHSTYKTEDSLHGRDETRHYLMLSNINQLIDTEQKWSKLNSIGMVEYIRIINGKTIILVVCPIMPNNWLNLYHFYYVRHRRCSRLGRY